MDRRKRYKLLRYANYYLPFLRHIRHRNLQRQIDKEGSLYYRRKIVNALNLSFMPSQSLRVAENPGGFLVEINNSCNLRCPMCSTHLAKRPKKNMELGVFTKLLECLSEEGITMIGLHTVGEPFCHPRLKEIVSMARRSGIEIGLSTNANMSKALVELYQSDPMWVHGFRFSIDGVSKEVYEKIRKGGNLDRVLESCEFILNTNRGLHMSRLALTIDCVISEDNLGELASFFRCYSRYTFPKDIRFGIMNSLSPDISYFEDKKMGFPNIYKWNVPCGMVFGGIYFNNEGQATLCCRDYDNQLIIGDALNTSIGEIWRSETAEGIREQHSGKSKLKIEQCKNCYGPKPGISGAVNNFLHFLWSSYPEKEDSFWKNRILDFLDNLNTLLASNDNANNVSLERFVDRHLR